MKKLEIAENEDLEGVEDGNFGHEEAESKAIEDIVKGRKDQISDEFRLFESITKKNSRQILRYVFQSNYANIKHITPLWYSHKNKVKQIPACEHCKAARVFEFQIMPPLFSFIEELTMVDWGTIVVYTCPNSCSPQDPNLTYIKEFSYIQFSEDWENIKYGENPQKSPYSMQWGDVNPEEEKDNAGRGGNKKKRNRRKNKNKQ